MKFKKVLKEELSRQQQNYFKDSKIRDDEGNLLVVYHGSPNPGFKEFNPKANKSQFGKYKFGDYNVNYFTKDKNTASGYTKFKYDDGTIYACYLNIVNPYIVNNKTEVEMKTHSNIKDDRLRQKEIQLFNRIFNKWKNKILYYSDPKFQELNNDLNKLNLELRPSDNYEENTDSEDIEYFDLYTLGNNSFFGAEHPIFYQYSTDEIFSDDMYEDLKETIIGEPDEYFFSTDDIVRYVISLNEEDGEDYDGIIIPDIYDSTQMFSDITTDYITLKSPNQIKSIDNVNPTSSNKINEDFDFERKLLYKGDNYTNTVKPNCIRLYHQTNKYNINSIIDNGLLTNKAKYYDNPGNCIWLSKKLPDNYSWNYGNSLIELDIPNELIDGSDFRQVNDNEYNCWFNIKPEYINAIYLQSPYRTSIMKDFQNTRDINKSLERFKNGELTERASDYFQLQKVNNRYPYERYWFAKTFKNEKSKEPEIHKIALQLQTDDINIVDEVLKEIIPFDYDRLRILGSTNNLNNLKDEGFKLLSLNEKLNESKTYEYPQWLYDTALKYFNDGVSKCNIENVSIKQLVDDNDLLNDNELQSYHQRSWNNSEAKDFHINQDIVNKYDRLSQVPFAYKKKDGKIELGDGKHRTRALYNDGYDYVKLPVIVSESLLNEVYPNKGESKKDFTKRFMSVTKDEYPDIKQRYAVCMSYWSRRNKKRKKNKSLNENFNLKDCIVDYVPKYSTYILKNGKFLDLYEGTHGAFQMFCDEENINIRKEIPDFYDNSIKCNDGKNPFEQMDYAYIEIHKQPTTTQYYSLLEWFDHLDKDDTVEIDIYDNNKLNTKTYSLEEYTSDEIIKKIKRYYASGTLYENLLNEKLIKGAGLDIFYTDSVYEAKNYLINNNKEYRCFVSNNEDIYLFGDAYNCIHRQIFSLAKAEGYLDNNIASNDFYDEGIAFIYVPNHPASEDNKTILYFRTQEELDNFKVFDLYKLLNKNINIDLKIWSW